MLNLFFFKLPVVFYLLSFCLLSPIEAQVNSFFELILSHQTFGRRCNEVFKCDKDVGLRCFMGSCECEENSFFDTARSSSFFKSQMYLYRTKISYIVLKYNYKDVFPD